MRDVAACTARLTSPVAGRTVATQCLVAARNHSWLIGVKSITARLGRRSGRGVSRSSASASQVSRLVWETPPNSSKVRSMIRHAMRP